MSKAIQTLLKSLGIDDSLLPDLQKDDFDVSPVIEKFNTKQKDHYYKIFENDSEFQQILTDKATGKVKSTYDNHFKKFGFEDEKGLPIPDKVKAFTEFYKEKVKKELNIPDVSKEIEELQKKNLELSNSFADKEKTYQEQIEQAHKNAEKTVNQKLADIELQKLFHSIEAKNLINGKHTPGTFNATKSNILGKFDIHYKDGDGVYFTEKGKESKPVAKINGKDVFLESKDILINALKEEGFFAESNGGGGSGAAPAGTEGGEKKKESAEVIKMREQFEQARREHA